jgi:hypothetical protein
MIALHLFGDRIHSYYVVPIFLGLFAMPMIALSDILEGTSRANHWPVMALSPAYIIRPVLIILFMLAAIALGAPHTAVTAMQAALVGDLCDCGRSASGDPRAVFETPLSCEGPRKIDFLGWLERRIPNLPDRRCQLPTDQLRRRRRRHLPGAARCRDLLRRRQDDVACSLHQFFRQSRLRPTLFQSSSQRGHPLPILPPPPIDAARWTFWPALGVGLVRSSPPGIFLLSLFGAAFTAGYILMAILLAGILAKALVGPAETLLMMAGKQNICACCSTPAPWWPASYSTFSLIPRFGIEGVAAIATASAMFVEAVLLHLSPSAERSASPSSPSAKSGRHAIKIWKPDKNGAQSPCHRNHGQRPPTGWFTSLPRCDFDTTAGRSTHRHRKAWTRTLPIFRQARLRASGRTGFPLQSGAGAQRLLSPGVFLRRPCRDWTTGR